METVPTLKFLNINSHRVTSHFIGHYKNRITAQLGGLYLNVDKSGSLLKLNKLLTWQTIYHLEQHWSTYLQIAPLLLYYEGTTHNW